MSFDNRYDLVACDCAFIMVDMQERFRDIIHKMDDVIKNVDILNRAAEILDIPLIVTEQSPEKLGGTIGEIYIPAHAKKFTKTLFSVFTDEVQEYVTSLNKPRLVIYGIEAHVCVTQSCLDAMKREFHVMLPADAMSSRSKHNKKIALKMLNMYEDFEMVSTEMLLFRLLKDAKHEKFREISKLVK